MRITVDVDESLLDDLARITGEKKKSPAVVKAVTEFVRLQKMREFGRLLREGAFAEAFEPGYDPSKLDS